MKDYTNIKNSHVLLNVLKTSFILILCIFFFSKTVFAQAMVLDEEVAGFAQALISDGEMSGFAQALVSDGEVSGFDQGLTVMDSEGNSVSSNGQYFFEIDGMVSGQEYVKNIQIMNLRDDKAYHLYLYAEPILNIAENVDLERDTICTLFVDGNEIYTGKVNGDGDINLREVPADLGIYAPGKTAVLKCVIVWNDDNIEEAYDNGHRAVDESGEYIIKESDEDNSYYGEVQFKWKFYAVIDEEYSSVKTGILSKKNMDGVLILCIGFLLLMISVLMILIYKKQQYSKQ